MSIVGTPAGIYLESVSIQDMIGEYLVSILKTACITEATGYASAYTAHEIRQGILQENPLPGRITILVNPSDPDDTSDSPSWSDAPVGLSKAEDWNIAPYEIGGGERWFRRFTIDVYAYLIRSQEDRSGARAVMDALVNTIQSTIQNNYGLGFTDDFGESAIFMLVTKVSPYEGGGPPRSFIWHSKIRVKALTER